MCRTAGERRTDRCRGGCEPINACHICKSRKAGIQPKALTLANLTRVALMGFDPRIEQPVERTQVRGYPDGQSERERSPGSKALNIDCIARETKQGSLRTLGQKVDCYM